MKAGLSVGVVKAVGSHDIFSTTRPTRQTYARFRDEPSPEPVQSCHRCWDFVAGAGVGAARLMEDGLRAEKLRGVKDGGWATDSLPWVAVIAEAPAGECSKDPSKSR